MRESREGEERRGTTSGGGEGRRKVGDKGRRGSHGTRGRAGKKKGWQ